MELVDVVDENNKLTGQIEERMVAYQKRLWRRVVSCWIMNENGEILLQKRSKSKFRNPGKWAKTGGQVDSGESPEEAIYREVKEELGIEIPKEQITSSNITGVKDSEKRLFKYNYIFCVSYKIDDCILQKEEVDEVKYVTIEDLELAKKNDNADYTFSNWDSKDFYKEMSLLKDKRKQILGE